MDIVDSIEWERIVTVPNEDDYDSHEEYLKYKDDDTMVEYSLEFHDNIGDHLGFADCDEWEMVDLVGEELASRIIADKSNKGRITDILFDRAQNLDRNDINSINDAAMKLNVNSGESGYILTDGRILNLFDHKYVSAIDFTVDQFVATGAIRISWVNIGFEFMKAPTRQQIAVLKELYGNKREIAVDFCEPSGHAYPRTVRSRKYSGFEFDQMIEDMTEFGNSNNESVVTFKSIVEQLDIY
jgi:hypothetical protein